ncbi:MAG: beta-galactosidase [Bacteroidales bacterium]|nr:beta-galactosidase [Bacteroidales bacterium]
MNFSIKENNFYLDNKKVFLNSGEIHYFRVKRELWNTHLEAAKEAGLAAVSSYVPWAWHEPDEGVFDFDGTTLPERDLKGWLKLCKDFGLTCILKPGPYILAEFRGAGLPYWFLNKYGEALRMHNSRGEAVPSDGVSLFHPGYIESVTHWYNHIMPFIREHEISNGGPVIMMQICNEIGLFSWLAHQADYSEDIRQRFIKYLESRFANIEKVNSLWGTNFNDFEHIALPPDGKLPYESKGDRSRDYEWHSFWRMYYAEYLKMLAQMARVHGVTVPFYHNLPGWIYGHGYEFPVNITMYEELYREKSDIIFGVDHIPEFMSHCNMHDDRIINDITIAMQGNKPLFAAEFQSGSREYHVVTNPREMELFYKASIANGLTGWNYYMFSQGRNPEKMGYSGDTFYWFTPLTAEGERTSAFSLVQRMSKLIKTNESLILEAKRQSEICVLFYPPYYATELERPEEGASGLKFSYSAIRRPAYFDGLLKALQVLNVDYDMLDLTKTTAAELNKYKQVWAFCTDEMNSGDQQTMINYVAAGGNLVIFPNLPNREMSQKPCAIIRDALSVKPLGVETIDSPLIDVFSLSDIKCANPQIVYPEETFTSDEVIARTLKGSVCGFSKSHKKGRIIHLGTWIGFDTEGHKPIYEALLETSGARLRKASSDNDFITVRQRFTDENSAMLFVGNYYNEEQTGTVTYTHPGSHETITIPFSGKATLWPALYAVLTPICMQMGEGLTILHSTSGILAIETKESITEITVFGDRDLAGEIVFEGENLAQINSITIDDEPVKMLSSGKRIVVNYPHKHREEFVIRLNF